MRSIIALAAAFGGMALAWHPASAVTQYGNRQFQPDYNRATDDSVRGDYSARQGTQGVFGNQGHGPTVTPYNSNNSNYHWHR